MLLPRSGAAVVWSRRLSALQFLTVYRTRLHRTAPWLDCSAALNSVSLCRQSASLLFFRFLRWDTLPNSQRDQKRMFLVPVCGCFEFNAKRWRDRWASQPQQHSDALRAVQLLQQLLNYYAISNSRQKRNLQLMTIVDGINCRGLCSTRINISEMAYVRAKCTEVEFNWTQWSQTESTVSALVGEYRTYH